MPDGRRLVGLDAARCVALVGMVAVHTLPTLGADGEPTTAQLVAGGRASALFAVLAGVTLALLTGGSLPVRGRERAAASVGLAVRALLVALVGLALGHADSGLAVILTYYGLLFLLGLPFAGLGWRPLAALALAWAVVVPVLSHGLRPDLPPRGYEVPSFDSLGDPGPLLADLAFTGYYPVVPWLAYLLVGMAVGRTDLARRSVAAVLVAAGLAVAVATTLLSRWWADPVLQRTADEGLYGVTPADDPGWLLVVAPHTATPFDLLQTAGSAAALIGVCLLVAGALRGRWLRALAVVFGAGTMTLTLYSLHVVLRTEPLWPPDDGDAAFRWHVLVLVWLGALFVAVGARGPLEQVVRSAARVAAGAVRSGLRSRPRP